MADEAPRSFRTKTGTCTVEGGRLVVERQGVRGAAANAVVGVSARRVLVIYLATSAVLTYFGVQLWRQGRPLAGGLFCGCAVFLAVMVLRSRNLSAVPEIPLADIVKVVPHAPRRPLTRGYFEVQFKQGEAVKTRLVILPGTLDGGVEEYEKALKVLTEAGLLKA